MFLKKSAGRLLNFAVLQRNCFRLSGVSKVLTEADTISQSDIDMILGNQPVQREIESLQKKDKELTTSQLFYGLLPTKNDSYPPCIDPEEAHILETPNQNIMSALGMAVDNSFDDYCNALNTFWKEDELYGSTTALVKIDPSKLEFKHLLTPDSQYLQKLRSKFVVNLSMPGSIEAEDPRNFMELRPVEEFRNTPIIPIAQQTMKKHKQKLEEYHRRQFVFEVSKQSIFNFVLFAVAAGICGYMVYLILQKEEERTVAYTRLKYNRKMGIQETPTFKI